MKALLIVLILASSALAQDFPEGCLYCEASLHGEPAVCWGSTKAWKLVDDEWVVWLRPDNNTVEFGPLVGRFEHPQYLQMVEDVDDGEAVGRLYWSGGKFEFEGNATASAKAFLEELNRQGTDFCGSR